jgi:Transposase C of IS166 homeodomain
MQLALEDIETTIAEQDAQEDKKDTAETAADAQRKKRCANRGSLTAHLPRIHVTLAPEIAACPCCHGAHDRYLSIVRLCRTEEFSGTSMMYVGAQVPNRKIQQLHGK